MFIFLGNVWQVMGSKRASEVYTISRPSRGLRQVTNSLSSQVINFCSWFDCLGAIRPSNETYLKTLI